MLPACQFLYVIEHLQYKEVHYYMYAEYGYSVFCKPKRRQDDYNIIIIVVGTFVREQKNQ